MYGSGELEAMQILTHYTNIACFKSLFMQKYVYEWMSTLSFYLLCIENLGKHETKVKTKRNDSNIQLIQRFYKLFYNHYRVNKALDLLLSFTNRLQIHSDLMNDTRFILVSFELFFYPNFRLARHRTCNSRKW